MGDDPYYRDEFLKRQLSYARHPEHKDHLLEHFRELREEYGKGEIFVEYFTNIFTATEDITLRDDDLMLTHLAVLPEMRRRGIDEALTYGRLSKKREESRSALVDCWETGSVVKLYEKLGFHSIIRAGPSYCDGSSGRLMGMVL